MLNLPGPPPTPGLVDPTSVRGDVIVRGASSVGKLAVGTADQGLKSDGTDVVWANVPTLGQVIATARNFNML